MKSEIRNKRKQWLDGDEAKMLDQWTKNADKLDRSEVTLKYFGFKQSANGFEVDSVNQNPYFPHSLLLFKVVLQKQIANENTGLPCLDQLPDYDALISIVGFSPEPLLHTILALAPMKVYPVATDESAKYYKVDLNAETQGRDGRVQFFEAIIQEYKDSDQNISVEPIVRNVASIGALDTFRRVREIIKTVRNNNDGAKIALDITGGKKSADVAAFLVGAIDSEVDIYYVDFEQYDKGKPNCGTEFLNKLDNPYDIYNIQLLNHAKALFENHRYDVAYDVFSQIEKKMNPKGKEGRALYGLEDEWHVVKKMKTAAKCYMYWDRYEFNKALNSSNCLMGDQKKHLLKLQNYDNFDNRLEAYKSDFLYDYILDRFLSARRRWRIGEDDLGGYHDAMLRYYQCVEIMLGAFIVRNQVEPLYDPDDKQNPLRIDDIRYLCFNGRLKTSPYRLSRCIEPHDLKGQIADLNKRRDEFVHVRPDSQNTHISKAELVVEQLIPQVFQKSEKILEGNLKTYTFKTSFDGRGELI